MKGSSLKQTDIHPARVVTMYSHHPNRSQTTVCITLGTVGSLEEFFLSSRVNALDSLQPKPWHHSPDSLHIHAKHSLPGSTLCSPPFFFLFFLLLVCLLAARSPNCNVRPGHFVRSLPSKNHRGTPDPFTVPKVGERYYRPQLSFYSTWTLGL